MPLAIRKNRNQDTYKVFNKITKEVHSYAATLENAMKQKRLIDQIDNNKKPKVGRKKKE